MIKSTKYHVRPAKTDQPGHLTSLIRVFAVRIKKAWVLSYPLSVQRRFWTDWADAQTDLSLRWAHMTFCWFCHEAAQIRWFVWMLCQTRENHKICKKKKTKQKKKKRPNVTRFIRRAPVVSYVVIDVWAFPGQHFPQFLLYYLKERDQK